MTRGNEFTTMGIAEEMKSYGLTSTEIENLGMGGDEPVLSNDVIAFRQGLSEAGSGSENPHFSSELRKTTAYKVGAETVALAKLHKEVPA
jgi:hypothetical protein